MVEILMSRAIHVLCVGGLALSMDAALAQENADTLQQVEALHGERWVQTFTGSADPEGEVTTGMDPPNRIHAAPEIDSGNDIDIPLEVTNFPEGQVTTGMDPPM